jgi:hypothetical protein
LAGIALAEEGRADDGRGARLKEAVSKHLVGSARAHGVSLPESEIVALLAVDIDLNAQGLEVWLRRRAKRAGASRA